MIRLAPYLLGLGVMAGGASADAVVIRSGEHPAFTRLAIDLPQEVQWTLTTAEGRALLALDLPGAEFDTSRVFERIPRERITDVRQDFSGGPLAIDLGCECTVRAFAATGRMLVVDVSDETPERAAPSDRSDDPANRSRTPVAPDQAAQDGAELLQSRFQQDLTRRATNDPRADLFERRLMRNLETAANNQILTLAPSARRPGAAEAQAGTTVAPASDDMLSPPAFPNLNLNSRVISSIDRGLSDVQDALPSSDPAENCVPDAFLDTRSWGRPDDFAVQIAEARSQMFREFDHLDSDAAIEMVRLLLYFSFGVEAVQALEAFDLKGEDRAVLARIGRIVDDRALAPPDPFAGQEVCPSRAAFWAFLSADPIQIDPNESSQHVMQAFFELSEPLKKALGERLSERLTRVGLIEESAAVLRELQRSPSIDPEEYAIAELRNMVASPDPSAAPDLARSIVESGAKRTPEALIEMVHSSLGRGQSVAPSDIATMQAHYGEVRNSELGAPLQEAMAIAWAMNSDFGAAFATISDLERTGDAERARKARSLVFEKLVSDGPDVDFLTHAFALQDPGIAELGAGLGNQMARRLLDLGFPQSARRYLVPEADHAEANARRLLRAEALLALNLPRAAELEIFSVEGPQADALRARAREMASDFATAARYYQDTDDAEAALRADWLAGSGSAPGADADPRYTLPQASEAAQETAGTGELARSRSLLEESETIRRGLSELLAAHALADGSDN